MSDTQEREAHAETNRAMTDAHKELRAAIANATGDDDAAPECTCAAKDMPFGRCCKVTPNVAVQPRAEGTSRCNRLLGGNAKEKT